MNCLWDASSNTCNEWNCYQFRNEGDCNTQQNKCMWQNGEYCTDYDSCSTYINDFDTCREHSECKWDAGGYFFGGYARGRSTPLVMWAVWIVMNIAFIGLILAVLGYGTWMGLNYIINIGIFFFALDIITRYVGFIMDLWGYTSLALIFISGGVVLLVGGWGIEKWRRTLISRSEK